jgi:predicted O-linked N-acetylglucosamine transferase (SPINDLY family)
MIDPAEAARLRTEAVRLQQSGRLKEAEDLFQRILAGDPHDPEARHMMGVLRLQQDRAAEALEILAPLVKESYATADMRTHHGLVLHALGRDDEALTDFDRALALKPANPMTLLYRGNVLLALGHCAEALESYERLLERVPNYGEGWFRRGTALWRMDRNEESLASYDTALQFDPGHFESAFNRGTVLLKLERYDEAFAAYERARALAPGHSHVLGAAASALLSRCDLAGWTAYRKLVVDGVRSRSAVIAPLTFMPFCDSGELRRICSETFAADQVPGKPPALWTGERYGHGRIRIAYLSADFCQHATAELIAGLIERHDRKRFEVTAISFGRDDSSPMRHRLVKGFDRFVDVGDRGDVDTARLLREGRFDIAVDLKGHTEGARCGILAHRPCPVQVSYLGYPGTVAPWLDYVIGDAIVLPFEQQPFYSEKIVHLPHSYQVNDSARIRPAQAPTREAAGLPESGFVFCCFNAAWKITPAMFGIWMRLLAAVPGSVLWLLEDNRVMPANLKRSAVAHGIDPARLVFASRVPPAAHLARHRLAGLFLDTLPYNAHTTASDALWMGLPVVTCLGAQFDGRVAASLLNAVGMPELVTHTPGAYETLALALARDPARLAGLKSRLAANRRASPLYDTDLFRRHIELAYLRMVEIARAGDAPRAFAVPA